MASLAALVGETCHYLVVDNQSPAFGCESLPRAAVGTVAAAAAAAAGIVVAAEKLLRHANPISLLAPCAKRLPASRFLSESYRIL